MGNEIKPSTSVANWNKTTFLLNSHALEDGVIFAFVAYFVNVRPVIFQIWRPKSNTTNEPNYALVEQWPYTPTNPGYKEVVSQI